MKAASGLTAARWFRVSNGTRRYAKEARGEREMFFALVDLILYLSVRVSSAGFCCCWRRCALIMHDLAHGEAFAIDPAAY